ncbi:MAG: mechanosensitive ion channel family protein [Bacteroidetes bacterium]|nr:mechanosensitive ion channel family protein [Bacteroidota bacterium]MCL5025058.1 mechanosensitive ion channel family protein [Chloroflexota bacterium]
MQALSISLHVALILAGALIALRVLDAFVHRAILRAMRIQETSSRERALKAHTLSSVMANAGRIVIVIIAGFMALRQLDFDIAPLLASAGIVGLALGLGAQSLIRDFISGFFILLEDQFGVGDVIKVGEHSGLVERMDLRRTVLRNVEGTVISIPNGEIRIVQNMTKEWSRVALDVNITNASDVDRAISVLKQVAAELAEDPDYGPSITEPPTVPGIEALGDNTIKLRVLVKTLPTKQWDIARALRARIIAAFDREDIEMTYHQRVVLRDERKPNGRPDQ